MQAPFILAVLLAVGYSKSAMETEANVGRPMSPTIKAEGGRTDNAVDDGRLDRGVEAYMPSNQKSDRLLARSTETVR
jgi:hypothetical protein